MDNPTGTSDLVTSIPPEEAQFTSRYVRRLLIERLYIYAKLTNPGGSVILRASDLVDHDRSMGYSSKIGNVFHLDLIDLQKQIREMVQEGELSKSELDAIVTWANGLTSQQAAEYLHSSGAPNIRKQRQRATAKLQERLDGKGKVSRRDSDRDSS